jgi:hypothetical protein
MFLSWLNRNVFALADLLPVLFSDSEKERESRQQFRFLFIRDILLCPYDREKKAFTFGAPAFSFIAGSFSSSSSSSFSSSPHSLSCYLSLLRTYLLQLTLSLAVLYPLVALIARLMSLFDTVK